MAVDLKPSTGLYREDYRPHLSEISPEVWERWDKNKDIYYAQCRKVIDYAVYYYGSRTPMSPDEIRARANLIFCIACLRWDPEGDAALPTYVATQLRRLSGTDIRVESKHKNNFSQGSSQDGEGRVDLLALIGKPDERDTLREYVVRAGTDATALYDACVAGWYDRKSSAGSKRPITPHGLLLSHVLPWTSKERYASALSGIREAADAWRKCKDFMGCVSPQEA